MGLEYPGDQMSEEDARTPEENKKLIDESQDEASWLRGYRAAMASVIQHAATALGYDSELKGAWIVEREAAVAALRSVCDDHGDNEWSDNLHLADVIEKHLARNLDRKTEE
jgi:hypothetical protein